MSTTDRTIVCPKCEAENVYWHSRCSECGEQLYNDIGEYIPDPGRRGRLWRFSMIVGIVGVGVWTLAMVGLFKMSLLLVFVVLIPWASLALTWKWSSVGGILLTIAGFSPLFIGELGYLKEQSGAFGAAFLLWFPSLPLILLSSVLFIFSRRA